MVDQNDRGRDKTSPAKKTVRRDFAHNILEVIGERGGEIFGSNVGGMLKNTVVAKAAQAFGESGINPDFVLNNLPYIAKLPLLNDIFGDTAEGVLRGLCEHLKPRLAEVPTDPDAQKVWLAQEFDAFKKGAKKLSASPTAAPQHLFQVVAGLDEKLRAKFDEMVLELPKTGERLLTQAVVLDLGRKHVATRDEVIAIITTSDKYLRAAKLSSLLGGAPLVHPPKEGLAAFAEELTKEATGQAKGLKPDGKYVKGFEKDAVKAAKRGKLVAEAIDDVLAPPPSFLRRTYKAIVRWF